MISSKRLSPLISVHTMDPERIEQLQPLETRLGHRFRDIGILDESLTHSSYVNENYRAGMQDNERMEFLGDAVLELAVSHMLMFLFPNSPEGELSRIRSSIVSEPSLAKRAAALDLGAFLRLGKGEERSDGRNKPSILADAYEAVMAACFLDRGLDLVLDLVQDSFAPVLRELEEEGIWTDHKSRLQELCQEVFRATPQYEVINESGPDHNKTFEVSIAVVSRPYATASGKSKKEAEQRAAKKALGKLTAELDGKGP